MSSATTPQPQSGPGAGAAPPDINTQTYPFDVVLYQLHKAADFNIFATPDAPRPADTDTPDDAFGVSGGYVINIRCRLHRFESVAQEPTKGSGLRVAQAVGEPLGTFNCRVFVSADDFQWSPGREPSPVLFDPTIPQRFVMLGGEFKFGDGRDGFKGYAYGATFPEAGRSRQLLAGAVGNLTEGYGRFAGLIGTYMLNGVITREFGFVGSITLRVLDWDGNLHTDSEVSSLTAIADPDPDATYVVLRGQKKSSTQRSEYHFGPDGKPDGLITPAEWRSARYYFTTGAGRGLREGVSVGQTIGSLNAVIKADLFGTVGTPGRPDPFTTDELYTFVDNDGQTVGTITTGVVLGDSFDMKFPALPGQPGLRFGGFGPIQSGTGPFAGVRGMLTVNSLIGIMPHALSLMHVFRIIDPDHKFRAAFGGGR